MCNQPRAGIPFTGSFATVGLLLLMLWTQAACAWSAPGHRMIATMAEQQLPDSARKKLRALLAVEGATTLAEVATWADDLRESDAQFAQRTGAWHFINFPPDGGTGLDAAACKYLPERDCKAGNCAVRALETQSLRLGNRRLAKVERLEALKWVVHLIGDLHQPLHTGYAFDRGGNDFQINWLSEGRNLHWVWDRLLIDSKGLSEAEYIDELKRQPRLGRDPLRNSPHFAQIAQTQRGLFAAAPADRGTTTSSRCRAPSARTQATALMPMSMGFIR
jgi:nuclease S1